MEEKKTRATPFTAFNFEVVFSLDNKVLCKAAFAEVDGLEITMEPKTYQEGGNNLAQIHLVGPITYGQLTLKRGMTESFDLWDWFDRVVQGELDLRLDGLVVMLASQRKQGGQDAQATFYLSRCLPVKLKVPSLNAKEGAIAIEEMQIVYERLKIVRS